MSANVYMKSIDLTTYAWQPLASKSTVVNASIWALPGMIQIGSTVRMRVSQGESVAVPFSTEMRLEGVDLAKVEVLWNPADGEARVLVIGTTR